MTTRLFNKPVTLREPVAGASDSWGAPERTFVDHPVKCYYWPLYSDNLATLTGELVMDTLTVHVPAGTVVRDDWMMVLDGLLYDVAGDIADHWNPRTEQVEYRSFKARRRAL